MNAKPQLLKVNKIIGIACLTILSAASSQAVDRFWSGGTSSYNNPASWGGTLPNGSDNAINNSGAGNTVLISAADPNWTINDIRSGDGGGNSGPWSQSGGNVTLNGWFRIGIGTGIGKYEMSGGTLTVNADSFNVGEGGSGLFNFTGGTINKNGGGGHLAVPNNGTGVMNQTNAVLNINDGEFWVGEGGGATGTYNLAGNGSIKVNNWVAIGRDNGTGTVNMYDTSSFTKAGANSFIIGASGPGTWNQFGGAVTNNSTVTWMGENNVGIWNLNAGDAYLANVIFGVNGSASGTFNLNAGTFAANQISKGGGSGTVNFNGGTLRARANSASFVTGVSGFLQAGGAVIDSQGFDVTISSTLADGAGGGLTKIGSGSATLSGANTYVGSTIVSAGKLIEGTASLVTTPVTVANTAGYGVSLANTNGQVSHNTVTLSGPANSLNFVLGGFGNPTVAPLNVTSTFSVNGTTTVNISDTLPQVGPIPLVSFVSRTGTGSFVLGTLPAGVAATLRTNTVDYANPTIELVISSTALIRWSGLVAGGVWDLNTTTNWTDYLSALSAKFTTGAAVFFDDVATGTTTANLGVAVSPGSLTVTNDNLAYTITGSGSINGATGLTKQGTNSLTISTTNSYSGLTTISGGTLSITKLANAGQPSAIGTASSFVLDGGTLSYSGPAITTDRGYSLTRSSTLDAQSDMTINGPTALTVGANFTKSGNGTLRVTNTGANILSLGGGGAAYNIQNGTLLLDGSAGAQVNTITGELWPGGTANSTGGNLIMTNTTLNLSSWFAIARGTGTGGYTSSVSLYNSKLTSINGSMCYDNGIAGTLQTGLLTLNGTSTYTNSGDGNMGESSGGTAIITVNDSSVYVNVARMMVGWHNAATGTLAIANSAKVVVNAWMSIGNEGGTGSVLVKNSGTLAVVPGGDLNVCDVNTGTGDLTIQDTATVVANALFVGKGNGSTGTYNQNGGTSQGRNGGGLYVEVGSQPFSTGTLNLNAGTFKARWIRNVNAGASYINFNGAQVVVARDGGDGVNADFLSNLTAANVLAGGANIDTGTNIIAIGQALLDGGGAGGLTKSGTGTLSLNGVNTYTGATLVSAGTLGGNGTIAGNVTVQATGTITAGDATGVGQLTINGNLTIQGNIAADIATSASPSNDVIVVTGTRSRTGTGAVTIRNLGPVPQVGQKFFLFNGAVTGAGTMAVTGGGATWKNDLAVDGSITVLTVLPAPTFTPGSVATLPDGNKSVTATATVGTTYNLWASSDVTLTPITTTWTLLSSGTVTTSPFTINDLSATNFTKRFYIFSTP